MAAQPPIRDVINLLPRHAGYAALNLRTRPESAITEIVDHWNGPPTSSDPWRQLVADANYHIHSRDWNEEGSGFVHGWAIMYHFGIDQAGVIYQLNPLTHILWHASNGNRRAIGILWILGKGQRPSPAMYGAAKALHDWLIDLEGIPAGRANVWGHGECGGMYGGGPAFGNSTECPGPDILQWCRAYRAGAPAPQPEPPRPPSGPERWADPVTGFTVLGDILAAYRAWGGAAGDIGRPLSEEFGMVLEDGNLHTCQLFERELLHWRAQTAPQVHRARIGAMLRPVLEAKGIIPAIE